MSDKMIPVSFGRLLKELISEYKKHKTFLGVPVNRNQNVDYMSKIGPAAGPHTQLAGNIIAAYGAGASHFELKTVQILEGEALGIVKPCIYNNAAQVCNTEWSTELTVKQAYDEYVKAYLLLKLLIREFELGNPDNFRFIMSIGYDFAGIKSHKIDWFIESMKDAYKTEEWQKYISEALDYIHLFEHVTQDYILSIPPVISDTITLSTMHGCKSSEIGQIAEYLLVEKKMNTYIKLNPTLLGKEKIHSILMHMGYTGICPDDEVFEKDIDFHTATDLIKRLQSTAASSNTHFGIKLTNTLPVHIKKHELAGSEMYLSGPVLYPITISVAAMIAQELDGNISISYSGGADRNNVVDILNTGIYPVTVSSVLLKPGGYKNITAMNRVIDEKSIPSQEKINVERLQKLAEQAVQDSRYFYKRAVQFTSKPDYSGLCSKCSNCVDVCPNRANKKVTDGEHTYIIHYDSLCNECGNCAFFCVEGHIPYLEKLTVFDTVETYENSENQGIVVQGDRITCRIEKEEEQEKIMEALSYEKEEYNQRRICK